MNPDAEVLKDAIRKALDVLADDSVGERARIGQAASLLLAVLLVVEP